MPEEVAPPEARRAAAVLLEGEARVEERVARLVAEEPAAVEVRAVEHREAELLAGDARSTRLTTTITTIRITCRAPSCRSCRALWPPTSKSCWPLQKAQAASRFTTATICWEASRKSRESAMNFTFSVTFPPRARREVATPSR